MTQILELALQNKYTKWYCDLIVSHTTKEKRLRSIKKYRDQNPGWDKNWQEGRKRAEPNRIKSCSKKTEVDGVVYPSATIAANILGLKKITLIKRVKSLNFPSYKYVENL